MSVLNREQIIRYLEDPHEERIFRKGSFSLQRVRSAGYDLRVARDGLLAPGSDKPVAIGDLHRSTLSLRPGEVAWVSTVERFCMPWNVAANIGAKFGFARQGLFIFTGLLVDPGFGLQRRSNGTWVPRRNERLYFPVTNIGPRDISIRLGDEGDVLLSLQFFEIDEIPPEDRTEVAGNRASLEAEAEARYLPLAFFSDVRQHERESARQFAELRHATQLMGAKLESVKTSTDQVVVFGMVLLSITLLAACFTILVQSTIAESFRIVANAVGGMEVTPGRFVLLVAAIGLAGHLGATAIRSAFSFASSVVVGRYRDHSTLAIGASELNQRDGGGRSKRLLTEADRRGDAATGDAPSAAALLRSPGGASNAPVDAEESRASTP